MALSPGIFTTTDLKHLLDIPKSTLYRNLLKLDSTSKPGQDDKMLEKTRVWTPGAVLALNQYRGAAAEPRESLEQRILLYAIAKAATSNDPEYVQQVRKAIEPYRNRHPQLDLTIRVYEEFGMLALRNRR